MSDNDNTVFASFVEDEALGLKAVLIPKIFASEALEIGIHGYKYVVRFSCAWYFCRVAHEAIELLAGQAVMEDETDPTASLRQTLESILVLYGSPEINEIMNYMPECRKLAFRRKLIWNPRFQAWLDSAGRAYDTMTREESALNKTD